MEEAYMTLRENLASELISQLKSSSPNFFEKVVVEVLVKMGYGGSRKDAGQAIGRSGDEGIDGIIKEDRLGLDIIYVQVCSGMFRLKNGKIPFHVRKFRSLQVRCRENR